MTYEAWRISYQDSEQAARAAYRRAEELAAKLKELESQDPVAYIDKGIGRPLWYPGALPSNLPHGTPLFARPVPAEPVNEQLVDALKRCEAAFDIYHSCFQVTGNETGMADAAKYILVARSAIAAAEAATINDQPAWA